MQRITLDNFRVFGTEASFDLAPVTVLTGKNNSGKSSLIKAFLVLADYLEQEDQTVLRLDGRRAGKHKIGTFAQLANWKKENAGNSVKLGYAKGQYEFKYEFDLEEDEAAATASLKQFNMRLIPLDLELVLSRNARLGGYYELSVNQQFIDYVTDDQGREVTQAYLTNAGDENRLAWLKAELNEVTGSLNLSMGRWVKKAQGQDWENNSHSPDFMELTSKKQRLEAQIKNIEQFTKRQLKSLPYRPQIQLAAIDGGTPTLSRIVQHGLMSSSSYRWASLDVCGCAGNREHPLPNNVVRLISACCPRWCMSLCVGIAKRCACQVFTLLLTWEGVGGSTEYNTHYLW